MNILVQLCGLVIIAFLFILYVSHKTLKLPSENVFLGFMIIAFFSLLLDALSVVAIHYRASLPEWLWKTNCKAYIISLIWVGWINFIYVSTDLGSTPEKHRRAEMILAGVTLIESVVVALLPIDVFEEGLVVYSYGPAVVTVYACTIVYILSTLATAIVISHNGRKRRGFAVIITTCIWVLAAGIQFLHNEYLLVGFSEAIGVMILYIVLENPDANLDKRYNCYNPFAFHEYIAACYQKPRDFSVMDISVTDVKALEDHGINVEAATRKVIAGLSAHRDVTVFKNDFANLVVISESETEMDQIATEFIDLISEYRLSGDEVVAFTLHHAREFKTSADLLNFLNYARDNNAGRLSTIVRISEDTIRNYRNIGIVRKEIDDALAEDRVEVFMQPIYGTAEKKIVSAEALVRIRKPDGDGYISPGAFIPVAESTGQIKDLGERVLEKVCAFLKESNVVALGLTHIDVNLSAVQCDDSAMAGRICRIVDRYGIDSRLINFEITETAVSSAKETLLENMNALISRGFHFALDDFGKGESNLIYIVEMPVKFIKLDIDMSKAYFANPKAKHVVASITDMAQRLGLPIVAEGIETREEADGITEAGVQLIQGYYFSRPLPLSEFVRYMESFCHADPKRSEPIPEGETVEEFSPVGSSELKGQRVLLVEDNELNREIAGEMLGAFGFSVDTAEDGSIAVDAVERAPEGYYDFILMDIRMPYMDGYEATRRIRALSENKAGLTPIIALTAYADDECRAEALAAGMDAVVPKPIDMELLLRTVREAEEKKNAVRT